MAKEFKTIDELIELLNSRGVATNESTAHIIQRESYYAIVNGYKAPFLDRERMKSSSDDIYLEGTSFDDLYQLFLFDRRLRQSTLPYLLSAESILKNAVVYAFCETNREHSAYLERSNYVGTKRTLVPKTYRGNKARDHETNLANLMRIFNEKISNRKGMRPFVRHYLDSYGAVPLWVLQNDLTFGNISHFFQLQKRGVQNAACKIVAEISGRNERLTPHDILRSLDVLVCFRNICAHDERLYCATVKGANYYEMYAQLSHILPRGETNEFATVLASLLRVTQGSISDANLEYALKHMGTTI